MSVPVLLAVPDLVVEQDLVAQLTRPGTPVTIARRCVDAVDLLGAAAAGGAATAVVGAGLPRLTRDTVARLRGAGVDVVGLVLAGDDIGERRLRALDVAVITVAEDDLDATVSAIARTASAPSGRVEAVDADPTSLIASHRPSPGRLIAVWGPTGAPGRTSVAITIADESARDGVPVLLVDADTHGGAVAAHLGLLDDVSGIVVACRQADTGMFDGAALAAAARTVHGRLRVLTGITRASRWPELRPAALARLWETCRETPGLTVVDAGFGLERDEEMLHDTRTPRRHAATLSSLTAADAIVAVGTADPVGMERLLVGLDDLRQSAPDVPLHVVVNRVRRSVLGRDPEGQVREVLSQHTRTLDLTMVPDDRAAFDACLREGRTLAEVAARSSARSALRTFSRRMIAVAALESPTPDTRSAQSVASAGGYAVPA
jgi:MinD-like ATPase involved in chromosome partitioning or flagellar assembly